MLLLGQRYYEVAQIYRINDYSISLELYLQRFVEYNLKLKLSKCKFGYQKLKVLGNILDTYGIKVFDQPMKE